MEEDKLIEKLSSIELPEVEPRTFRQNLHRALINQASSKDFKQYDGSRLWYGAFVSGFRRRQLALASLLVVLVIGVSVAVPTISKAIGQAHPISVSPTDTVDWNIPNTNSIGQNAGANNSSLSAIKTKLGQLFVPSKLPTGFKLEQSILKSDQYSHEWVELVYTGGSSAQAMIIGQDKRGVDLNAPASACENVTVRGLPGILVRGTWGVIMGQSSAASCGLIKILWYFLPSANGISTFALWVRIISGQTPIFWR